MYFIQLEEVFVEAEYNDEKIEFPVWRLDTEKWMLDILYSPALAPELRFDAERLFRHDGEKFVRFINEPWTANRWHKVQVCLRLSYFCRRTIAEPILAS